MNPYQLMLLKTWAISYLLNSLWQLPLIALAATIAARLARPAGPRTQHRIWVAALFAQIVLPACQFELSDLIGMLRQTLAQLAQLAGQNADAAGQAHVLIGPIQATESGLHLPSSIILAMAIAYLAGFVFCAARLAWGLSRTHALNNNAQALLACGELRARLNRYCTHFQIATTSSGQSTVRLATSGSIASPVTFGLRRQILVFPPQFLDSVEGADLDAVLAHECAHIRRRDYAKNVLYEFLSLPIAFHPALWLTRAHLAETREMLCDELAAQAVHGRERYAHSLLRLAASIANDAPAKTLHAIGIFDANIFERRVMHLTQKPIQLKAPRRFAIAVAAVVVAGATCASALAFHVAISPAAFQAASPKKIHVKADVMKIISQVPPVYPQEAKEHKIEGTVVLAAVIGKGGEAENLRVVSGPKELQMSALDAVRQWKWQPYLLNGEPIEVDTTLNVVYSLEK
jgi:TonB family protein